MKRRGKAPSKAALRRRREIVIEALRYVADRYSAHMREWARRRLWLHWSVRL